MKNKAIKGALLGSIITLMFACNPKKGEVVIPAIDKEQIKKEIQAKEDEYAATYNAGEIKNIGFYADDAVSYYQNRMPLVGKEAIIDFLKSGITSNTNAISFKTNEVFVSNDGNQVVEIGHFTVVDSTNKVINSGNYMTLFEKRNGKYVSIRDMSNSEIPKIK